MITYDERRSEELKDCLSATAERIEDGRGGKWEMGKCKVHGA